MPRIVDHEARRAELAEVTARQIAAVGLERLHLRDVARAAGCTTGTVTHYFNDKQHLLLATFRSRTALALRRFNSAVDDGADELDAIIESTLPLDAERRLTWQVWLAFWGAAIGDAELSQEQQQRAQGFRELVERALRARQATRRLPAGLDVEPEARRLV